MLISSILCVHRLMTVTFLLLRVHYSISLGCDSLPFILLYMNFSMTIVFITSCQNYVQNCITTCMHKNLLSLFFKEIVQLHVRQSSHLEFPWPSLSCYLPYIVGKFGRKTFGEFTSFKHLTREIWQKNSLNRSA